jgi:membrane protein
MDDKAMRLAAALSYYTIFSLAPLLVLIIAVAGLAFGVDSVRTQMMNQLEGLLGPQGAGAVSVMLQNANRPNSGIIAGIISIVTLLLGATGVVIQLKDALNTIWDIQDDEGGVKDAVKDRVFALGMILSIGFLLIVSLVISAILSAVSEQLGSAFLWKVLNFVLSIGIITMLFALMFKYLPDTNVEWRNVWIGAFVTAVLFTIGKTLTAIYLANSSVSSAYGAAGSLVIVLLWVYYNSLILFLGAEFTQVYSNMVLESEKEGTEQNKEMEEEEMANQSATRARAVFTPSTMHKVAFRAGFQIGRIEHSADEVKKKIKMAKWGAKIVDFLGIKRSAKWGWKGFKIKRKIDALKKDQAA